MLKTAHIASNDFVETIRIPSFYRETAWAQLGLAMVIILGGAFVRATGSGAGCGEHWPLCNGQPIPVDPTLATLIEFSHRISSSLLGLVSLGQWLWARRQFAAGTAVRRFAGLSFLFVCIEGLIGALIVKLGLVADNTSMMRAFWVGGHLVNTLILVALMAYHGWYAGIKVQTKKLEAPKLIRGLLHASLGLILVVSASGAVVALGDTLFPAHSLAHGFAQKNAPDAHFLVKLRWYHPLLALVASAVVVTLAMQALKLHRPPVSRAATICLAFVASQLLVGLFNWALLVPIPLQLLHLLVANGLWLSVWRLHFVTHVKYER